MHVIRRAVPTGGTHLAIPPRDVFRNTHRNSWGGEMTQQFSRIALFAAAIGLANTGAFAQQAGGATRGSSTGQTTQGTTETRPTTPSESAQRSGASAQLAGADQAFVKEAATGGLMEVELGRLAAEKASSAEVK